MTSVGDLMALAQEQGFQLTGADLQTMAQQAYQAWLDRLTPSSRPFFEKLHADETLNKQHTQCRSPADVIALATEHGFDLTETDLTAAAEAAAAEDGFSFEKLWFKSLGML